MTSADDGGLNLCSAPPSAIPSVLLTVTENREYFTIPAYQSQCALRMLTRHSITVLYSRGSPMRKPNLVRSQGREPLLTI